MDLSSGVRRLTELFGPRGLPIAAFLTAINVMGVWFGYRLFVWTGSSRLTAGLLCGWIFATKSNLANLEQLANNEAQLGRTIVLGVILWLTTGRRPGWFLVYPAVIVGMFTHEYCYLIAPLGWLTVWYRLGWRRSVEVMREPVWLGVAVLNVVGCVVRVLRHVTAAADPTHVWSLPSIPVTLVSLFVNVLVMDLGLALVLLTIGQALTHLRPQGRPVAQATGDAQPCWRRFLFAGVWFVLGVTPVLGFTSYSNGYFTTLAVWGIGALTFSALARSNIPALRVLSLAAMLFPYVHIALPTESQRQMKLVRDVVESHWLQSGRSGPTELLFLGAFRASGEYAPLLDWISAGRGDSSKMLDLLYGRNTVILRHTDLAASLPTCHAGDGLMIGFADLNRPVAIPRCQPLTAGARPANAAPTGVVPPPIPPL